MFRNPASQVLVVLGLFAAVMLAGRLGLELTFPFALQVVEVTLAVAGALWLGRRGAALLGALGLSSAPRRGVLLALLGATPMALGLSLPALRATVGGAMEAAVGGGGEGVLTALLTGAVLAPIGEELLFRGYAVGGLLDAGWSRGRAFVVPGVIFGLLHVPGALAEGLGPAVMTGAVTAAGGIWYGWLYLRWGRSVWVALAAHMAMNTWWILGSVGPVAGSGGTLPNLGRGLAIALITVLTVRWTRQAASG